MNRQRLPDLFTSWPKMLIGLPAWLLKRVVATIKQALLRDWTLHHRRIFECRNFKLWPIWIELGVVVRKGILACLEPKTSLSVKTCLLYKQWDANNTGNTVQKKAFNLLFTLCTYFCMNAVVWSQPNMSLTSMFLNIKSTITNKNKSKFTLQKHLLGKIKRLTWHQAPKFFSIYLCNP